MTAKPFEGPLATAAEAKLVPTTAAASEARRVIVLRIAIVVVWLIAWELIGRENPVLLSYPTLVIAKLVSMVASGEMLGMLMTSGETFVLGWLVAVGLGAVIGLAIGGSRPLRLMFEPFINALYATPLIVLIPLLVLWFGLGISALLACVTMVAVFPMLVMTITGVQNAGSEYVEIARSFRLGPVATLFKVIVPGALPYMYVGLRLSTARALTGTIIAEFLIPSGGIGDAINEAGDTFDADRLYALIITVAVLAMILDVFVRRSGAASSVARSKQ